MDYTKGGNVNYQQYITTALWALCLLLFDMVARYLIALAVGIAYSLYSGVIGLGIAMSHFGMLGKMMNGDLFLMMIVEVPAWTVLAKILAYYWKSTYVELMSAIVVAIVVGMLWNITIHPLPILVEGNITIDGKKDVLLWHLVFSTNLMLGMGCALVYSTLKPLMNKQPSKDNNSNNGWADR